LLPMSMMVMFGLACCRASSSQLARWLNVSRLSRGPAVAETTARSNRKAAKSHQGFITDCLYQCLCHSFS
jgi:hypothetical protein